MLEAFLICGGICVTSLGTFSSCKNYDDDISNLQTQINDLNKILAELQAQIKAGKLLSSVESKDYGILVKLSSGEEFKITNGKNGARGEQGAQGVQGVQGEQGKPGTVWTISDDGFWVKDGTKTSFKAVGKDGVNGKDGVYYVPDGHTGKFVKHIPTADGKETTEQTEVSFLAPGTITAVKTDDTLTFYNVDGGQGANKEVVIQLSDKLTALVFNPSLYYEGIQAASINRYNLLGITLAKADVNEDMSNDEPKFGDQKNYSPDMTMNFFLNPANAKINADKKNFDFVAYNKAYTRAAEDGLSSQFECTGVTNNKGMLTATVKYAGKDNLKEIANDANVTVLALRYKGENGRNVVSDFAALKQYRYNALYLNNAHVKGLTKEGVLHLTAQQAINAAPTLTVLWNKTISLDTCVNAVRAYVGGEPNLKSLSADKFFGPTVRYRMALDEKANDKKAQAEGFTYKYELVGYEHANIQQSKYAKLEGAVFTPTDENGKANDEKAINKSPLVRISLLQGETVVAVAYVKIKITREEDTVALTTDKAFVPSCTNEEVVIDEKYDDVIKKLADILHITPEKAKSSFELKSAQLFGSDKDEKDGEKVVVEENHLKWLIPSNISINEFLGLKHKSIETTLYFEKKAGSDEDLLFDKVAVKLTWTPKEITKLPTLDLANYKNKSLWAKKGASEMGTGFDEVRINTTPFEYGGTKNLDKMRITYDLSKVFIGNGIAPKFEGNLAQLNSKFTVLYQFGKKKGMGNRIDGDYSQLTYDNLTIATMNMKTGEITYLNSHLYAQALLNYNGGKKDLSKSLTLPVKVLGMINCDGKGQECYPIEIKNNTFNAVVLRPINVDNSSAEFFDAAPGKETQAKFNVKITDWRNADVESANFAYFGIKDIYVHLNEATTNMAGKVMKLSDVTSKLKIDYKKSTIDFAHGGFGYFTYFNSDQVTADFEIYVPATLKYSWGKLPFTITITIHKTAVGK